MSNIAQAIARGDFSQRVLAFSKEELGDLAKAFNHKGKTWSEVKQR